MVTIPQIINQTNQIADGIMANKEMRGFSVAQELELQIASIEAASKIMQAILIGKEIDNMRRF
jgi:hypothetical protein